MRPSTITLLPTALLLSITTAIQLPHLQPFFSAIDQLIDEYVPRNVLNSTLQHEELRKRQTSNGCPTDFKSCANLGAPNLCCVNNAVCSADYAGKVACCPSGAACTGTISGVITSGTLDGHGGVVGATGSVAQTSSGSAVVTTSFQAASSSSSNNGLVAASTQSLVGSGGTTSGGGFIVDGSSTVASPNGVGRAMQMPLLARAIIRALQYIPI